MTRKTSSVSSCPAPPVTTIDLGWSVLMNRIVARRVSAWVQAVLSSSRRGRVVRLDGDDAIAEVVERDLARGPA